MIDRYPPAAHHLIDAMRAAAAQDPKRAVAFQGAPGAYSHQALCEIFPDALPVPCYDFADALDAVRRGDAAHAVIPIENSLHGRVSDIHFLLPESGLFIVAEHFVRISHCLLARPGVTRAQIREALSHPQALGQSRKRLREWGISPVAFIDTAAAAAFVAGGTDPACAAIASRLAGELYGLDILEQGIEDAAHNTTRFVVLAREALSQADQESRPDAVWMTSLLFETRNVPSALYKAIGGFATNGVNMTKLESYVDPATFSAAEFYVDIIGRPGDTNVDLALEELTYQTRQIRILGTYPQARPRG